MRHFMILVIIKLLAYSSSFAQEYVDNTRFKEIDAYASKVSKQAIFDPQLIVNTLTNDLSNDYDKVRAIYVWIAKTIEYDFFAFIHDRNDGQNIRQVLSSGKALCSGYSLLFKSFCDLANIQSVIIEGYAKGYGYKKGQKFKRSNHAWNAVNIYGYWYLLDVTWATGSPTNLSKHQKQIDLNTYFLSDPKKFIKTHLPEDPSWQLVDKKVSLSKFEDEKYDDTIPLEFNSFAPTDYDSLNDYDKDILKYKRSILFNPKNEDFIVLLSLAHVYKGISLTDGIWEMDFSQLLHAKTTLEETFYAYMDSASTIRGSIKYSNNTLSKSAMEDEINYQKGVFNYELGTELFRKSQLEKKELMPAIKNTSRYFNIADDHFKNVPATSIYVNDAKKYLQFISDFNTRNAEYYIVD